MEKAKTQVNSNDELISKISFTEENEYYDEGLQDQINTDISKINDIKKEVGLLTNRMRDGVKKSRKIIEECKLMTTDNNLNEGEEENKINVYSIVSKKVNEKIDCLGQSGSDEYTKWMLKATLKHFEKPNGYNQDKSIQEILKDNYNELLTIMSKTITL